MQGRREPFVPASTLDPYTRLLATLADAASRARYSLPTSFAGRVTMWSALACIGTWTAVTLVLWSPLIVTVAWGYVMVWLMRIGWQWAVWSLEVGKIRIITWVERLRKTGGVGEARREAKVMKGVRRAASDDGFMRSVLHSLPGVDAERVLARVGSLTNFALREGGLESQQEEDAQAQDENLGGGNAGHDRKSRCSGQVRAGAEEDAIRERLPAGSGSLGGESGGGGKTGQDLLMDLVRQGYMVMTGSPPRSRMAGEQGGESSPCDVRLQESAQ